MRRKLCSSLEVEVLETWQILEGGQEKFSLYAVGVICLKFCVGRKEEHLDLLSGLANIIRGDY